MKNLLALIILSALCIHLQALPSPNQELEIVLRNGVFMDEVQVVEKK